MSSTVSLRELHARCDCVIESTVDGVVAKHQCRLRIEGLRVAVDCDLCSAFGENTKRPDIIAIQRGLSSADDRWLIVEIKGVMDSGARRQAEAGLQAMSQHDLFNMNIKRARVCFAFRQRDLRRTADRARLRKPLKFHGKSVPVRVVRCDGTIPRRWQ